MGIVKSKAKQQLAIFKNREKKAEDLIGRKQSDYKVVSLFSGAMGFDLGIEAAGLEISVAQDVDPWCVKTAEANGRQCVPGDIKKLVAQKPDCSFLLAPAKLARNEVFAVIGGPPCQPFSTAGKRLSTNDPRGSLFMDFRHVIKSIRPRFFVMENVKGLLSSAIVHRPIDKRDKTPLSADEQPGSAINVIMKSLLELGYAIKFGLLDSVHYGTPQFRERLVIIGSRENEEIFLPAPTNFQRHQSADFRWRTLRDSILSLEEKPGSHATFSKERVQLLRQVPMGGNWSNLPKHLVKAAMGGAFESAGGKMGFYRRLDYDQPSPTLVTSPVQKATMLCHPTQDRPLSVLEYARIQEFPADWEIAGSLSDCYRQIGNAVPVGLGKAIGQVLRSVAEGKSEVKTKRTRGTSVHISSQNIQNLFGKTG